MKWRAGHTPNALHRRVPPAAPTEGALERGDAVLETVAELECAAGGEQAHRTDVVVEVVKDRNQLLDLTGGVLGVARFCVRERERHAGEALQSKGRPRHLQRADRDLDTCRADLRGRPPKSPAARGTGSLRRDRR